MYGRIENTLTLESRLNILYIAAQGFYWMIVCCTISMGSAYLTNRGYTTIGIGFLYAVAYLIAALLQQVLSVACDRTSRFNVLDILAVLGALLCMDLLFAIGTNGKEFATGFTFLIAVAVATIMLPFLNSLNFHIEKYNIRMNYGLARAGGSFFFFLISLVIGNMMRLISENVANVLGLLIAILFVVVIIMIFKELKSTGLELTSDYDPFLATSPTENLDFNSIKLFIYKYKMFFIFLLGVICYYFGHVLINNFIYLIAENVGGDEADTGGLLAVQAIVELPAMIFFFKLKERFSSRLLLSVSAVFYFIKILATTLASNVGMLYFSMLFQSLAFALFIPASVYFVDEIMPKEDAVKGQAFITVAMTIGNLLSSLLGGLLIRIASVKVALWFGSFVTLCGLVISIYGLVKIKSKNL